MKENRLYKDLAWTWPIISPPSDYVKESEEYRRLIGKHSKIEVKTLLDLGCGGGHNDFTLKRYFEITGVDVSSQMLEGAKKLNPEVTYLSGDMRSVRLGKTFDAVTIFDSISYMLTVEELHAAFQTAYVHLNPGGVFLTYMEEETPERFTQNKTTVSTHTKGGVEITLIENQYDPDPRDTTFEATFIFLIRRGGDLAIEADRHLLGIFPLETWTDLLKEAGFDVKVVEIKLADPEFPSVPTLIGIKPLK